MANHQQTDIVNKEPPLDLYEQEGLRRLAKEKLVTIISNLQNMPVELAMKVSDYSKFL